MIVIKVLVQTIIISIISAYTPQSGLNDSQKNHFYNSLINVVRNLWKKETEVIADGLSGDLGSNADFENQHGRYTAQKIKFSVKDFFCKCDQIHSFL